MDYLKSAKKFTNIGIKVNTLFRLLWSTSFSNQYLSQKYSNLSSSIYPFHHTKPASLNSSFKAFLKNDSLDIEDIKKIIDNYIKDGGNTVVDNSKKDVNVKAISGFDDLRGIIVEIKKGRKKYHTPLCEIEPTDYDSENWELIGIYTSWFWDK